MTADPYEIASTALARAANEFEGVRRQCDSLRLDNHQLKRRLERAEERYQDLETRYVALEQQLADSERSVERSRRALLEHAGRTS